MKKDPTRHQVLRVKGCFAGSGAENLLEQGDMILAINKQAVTCFRDIEDACQALDQCSNSDGKLNMTIFRQVATVSIIYFHVHFSSNIGSMLFVSQLQWSCQCDTVCIPQ